ncbi:MAG: GNAT family N-acetyltransferase [Cyclobacteriaceae bacterium]|nr:GNAT family N-acetyltransferase [Cyclobacteriaceae bacterium]
MPGNHHPLIAFHHSERPAFLSGADLDRYLASGWFRMHQEVFTTTHLFSGEEVYRVHWLRFPIAEIPDRATHRRLRRKNAGFRVAIEDFKGIRPLHEKLYSVYRASIDFEGADSVNHALFGEEEGQSNLFDTKSISVFLGDRLIAAGYLDVGHRAGASILHFYDPEFSRYSLGKYLILLSLDILREKGVEFYYPGYVVAGRGKMNYKLFLGKEVASWFDVRSRTWRPFDERILQPEVLSELDRLNLAVAMLS